MRYQLQDAQGREVRMKNGDPFTYSTRGLAVIGKHYLDIRDSAFYRIAEVPA